MSLLSRWFKSKTAPAAKVAKATTPTLDQQTPQELATFAAATDNDNVRSEAIARLDYSPELLQLAQNPDSRVHLPARKHLGELLEQGNLTAEQVATDVPNQGDLLALVGFSRAATLAVIATISDPSLLLQLACEGTTTQIRQAAATRITARAQLEQLCKHAQGKDKSVFKIAKQALDAIKADVNLHLEAQAALAQVCEKLEKLARLEADNLFKAKLELLAAEGQPLAAQANAELQRRYTAALDACRQQLTSKAQHLAQQQEQQQEQVALAQQANTFVDTALSDLHQLIAELYALDALTPEQAALYQQQLADLERALAIASGDDIAPTRTHQHFATAHDYASDLLATSARNGTIKQLTQTVSSDADAQASAAYKHLCAQVAAAHRLYPHHVPDAIIAAGTATESWQSRKAQAEQRQKKSVQDIVELTRRGLRAAQQGMVRKARGCYNEAQEKSAALSNLPAGVKNKVDELHQAIERLSDWHDFAVTPKKKELITHMQSLSSSSLNPADLAEKIHALQDEWKELSRGVHQDDEDLWHEFQQAAQLAFAPCKVYFDAQAQTRAANLEKRRELVTQLQTYLTAYDWQAPIWSDVEKTLKVARQEWLSYWPVPRKAAEELQTVFDTLMEQLHQKIKTYQSNNKAAKLEFIEQAKAWVSAEDLPQAIEQAKRLQAQWKTIGKTFAREDQQLWREFRKHCDAIFARRADEIAAVNHERQAQLDQAHELIAQAAHLSEQPAAELVLAEQRVDELKGRFNTLQLPKDKARPLAAELDAVLNRIERKIIAERNRAAIQSWQDLFKLSDSLRQYELAALTQAPSLEQQRDSCRQHLDTSPVLPEGSLDILQRRLTQADELTTDAQPQNQQVLRLLCIRAEILLNQESPPEDRALRMNYLMQQLQQGLGQQEATTESLAYEWISVAAVSDADYQPLFTRFMQALSSDPQVNWQR